MTHTIQPTPPAVRRQLGRSRRYTGADLPKRLVHWHAPRANGWERLCVHTGVRQLQWLDADGIAADHLHAGDERWIAPDTRWRVAHMDAQASFQLEIHADDATPVGTPHASRTTWFDAVECVQPDNDRAFMQLVDALGPARSVSCVAAST